MRRVHNTLVTDHNTLDTEHNTLAAEYNALYHTTEQTNSTVLQNQAELHLLSAENRTLMDTAAALSEENRSAEEAVARATTDANYWMDEAITSGAEVGTLRQKLQKLEREATAAITRINQLLIEKTATAAVRGAVATLTKQPSKPTSEGSSQTSPQKPSTP